MERHLSSPGSPVEDDLLSLESPWANLDMDVGC